LKILSVQLIRSSWSFKENDRGSVAARRGQDPSIKKKQPQAHLRLTRIRYWSFSQATDTMRAISGLGVLTMALIMVRASFFTEILHFAIRKIVYHDQLSWSRFF